MCDWAVSQNRHGVVRIYIVSSLLSLYVAPGGNEEKNLQSMLLVFLNHYQPEQETGEFSPPFHSGSTPSTTSPAEGLGLWNFVPIRQCQPIISLLH